MKSKLAIWSFISALIIIVVGFSLGDLFYKVGIIWVFLILYLIPLGLGIKALLDIKKSKNLTGKVFAIIGIILSVILYLFNLIPLFS